jgi:copper(I)-binding protein
MRRLALLAILATGPAAACPGLEVADAWIAEAPPGASALAGYATLQNRGKVTVAVSGANSREFESAMLHETVVRDGMAHMEHLDRLALAPGASVRLNPGGKHLMLVGPKRALKAGDRVEVSFDCGSSRRKAAFIVRRGAP